MSGLQILVPSQRRSFVPVVKLRNESSLSPAEWDWIRSTASMDTAVLAKNCAVSKDDPLHHLKVEFAHATAKLSKMTKLKWNPSDIYTLDTMKIFLRTSPDSARVVQESQSESINMDGGQGAQEVLSDNLLTSNTSSIGLEAPSIQERLAAMDLDPVWRCQDVGQKLKNGEQDEDAIRVIMFIKPTRHASQPQERFNAQQFELCSFPLFDAIHHSVFNTATYHRLRKTMHELSNEIEDLECELEMNSERDREGKGSKDMISEQMNKGDKHFGAVIEDAISSLLINDLGIKGEEDMSSIRSRSPRTPSRSHSINRNSFVSDNALHGPRSSRQSSMYSLLESFQLSGPSVGSVMSIATSYASATPYASFSENIPQAQGNSGSLSYSISRQTLLEAAQDRELPELPPGAEPRPEFESSRASSAEPARAELMRHRSSNGSFGSHSRSVSSSSSLKALPLRTSYYGQSYPGVINGLHQSQPQPQPPHQQHVQQQQHQRAESLSLANVTLPRHRRSYSHIQAESGPQPTNGSPQSRARTTSQSSSVLQQHPPTSGSVFGSVPGTVPGTAPVTPQRRLMSANKSGVSSPPLQFLQPPHHNSPNLQSPIHLPLPNSTMSNVIPQLERLERQQQQIQQQWRMVSWTRQLNEWDHARMLKNQEQLLGFTSTGPSSMASSQLLPDLPSTVS